MICYQKSNRRMALRSSDCDGCGLWIVVMYDVVSCFSERQAVDSATVFPLKKSARSTDCSVKPLFPQAVLHARKTNGWILYAKNGSLE